MAKVQRVGLDEIIGYFDELEDPRDTVNRKHPLVSVVVIALMAVLSSAGGATMGEWAGVKAEFRRGVLPLAHGVPRKDVFRRVLGLLQPAAFQACFATWLQALRAEAAEGAAAGRPVFAVDGKTARRSHDG